MSQGNLMNFCPASGGVKPYPSHADQWRDYHGKTAWLFNPWTGERRSAQDVGSDPVGRAMATPVAPKILHGVEKK